MAICLSANTVNKKLSYNVVVLHASPNKNSHTEKLTKKYLSEHYPDSNIKDFDIFSVSVKPCNDCKYCHTHNNCCIDDGFESIASEIDKSDVIIISTPVYFLGFPAPMKAFIDRTQQLFVRRILKKNEKLIYNKAGILIASCGGEDISAIESLKAPAEMFFSVFGAKFKETVYLTDTDKTSL